MKLKTLRVMLIVTIILVISGCIYETADTQVLLEPLTAEQDNPEVLITAVPLPELTASQPTSKPALREYVIDKSHDIWHAKDSSSYITPGNEWVQYYAGQLYVDSNGWVRYKNQPIPYLKDERGNVLEWYDKTFVNTYILDKERDNDYWMMPDYYLANGLRGDCEDFANTLTSMMLSGEMSVGKTKQIIPAKTVIGYGTSGRDAWVEYIINGVKYKATTGILNIPYGAESVTTYKRDPTGAVSVFEFNKTYFGKASR